jgi:glycosyltransferase involved in cell wall biosynthesis
MKILLIADRLSYNGRSTYALNLSCGLKETEAALLFCLTGGDLRYKLDDQGIENYIVKYNFFSFRKLLSFLTEFEPDLIHVTSERALLPGQRIARGLKLPFVVTIHDLPEKQQPKLNLSEIQGIIAPNEGLREVLVNRLNIPKHWIRLVPKGVDLTAFDIPAMELGDRLPVIGCVGRMAPGKGQDHFLRAARQVLDSGHEAMFLLVGKGREEPRLRRMLKELNLTEAVTISPPVREAKDIYRVLDVLVLPATQASSSATALEAMAARRPVIASVVGDLLHLIKNEENGLAVEPGNAEGIARAICRFLDDPGFARELGERARQFVSRRYPQSRMIEETVTLYEDIQQGDFPRK